MKTINTAKTNSTNDYYYSYSSERFGSTSEGANHGFKADVKIVVDSELSAQELDVIFNEVL